MPHFMDRHPANGETLAEVALMHECDLNVQDQLGVKVLTYWYHEGASTGFCLFEAPNADMALATHRAAHGAMPTQIIPVDLAMVEGFLGPIRKAHGKDWREMAFRTIVCLAVGDSDGSGSARDAAFPGMLARETLDARGGSLLPLGPGGNVVGCFPSLTAALESALAIQRSFASVGLLYASDLEGFRIGISAGEPVTGHLTLFGDATDEASVLCSMAESGSIFVSSRVHDLCEGRGFVFGPERRAHDEASGEVSYHALLGKEEKTTAAAASRRTGPAGLSQREVEVLALVSQGMTNQEIGERLFISQNTVASHLRSIFDKAQVANRAEAAAFAFRHALVS